MEKHPGICCVRIAPWALSRQSFRTDCQPRGTSLVFLFSQAQRQPSPPSLSPRVHFLFSLPLLVSEIFSSLMHHPLHCPLDFPLYFLPLLTLGFISWLFFFIHPEHRSILLEERSGFAGEGHQGAEFELPTLIFSTGAQKDRQTGIRMMRSNNFFLLSSFRKLAAEKKEKVRLPFKMSSKCRSNLHCLEIHQHPNLQCSYFLAVQSSKTAVMCLCYLETRDKSTVELSSLSLCYCRPVPYISVLHLMQV